MEKISSHFADLMERGLDPKCVDYFGYYENRNGGHSKFYNLYAIQDSANEEVYYISTWGRIGNKPGGTKIFTSAEEALKTIRLKAANGYTLADKGSSLCMTTVSEIRSAVMAIQIPDELSYRANKVFLKTTLLVSHDPPIKIHADNIGDFWKDLKKL